MRNALLSLLSGVCVLGLVAAPASAFEVRATAKDNGKTAHLDRGDVLQVTLTENPSTGFTWRQVKRPDGAVLKQLSDRFVAPRQTNPPIVGAPGRRVIRWRAVGRGQTSLKIQLFGPGRNARAAQTYRLSVVVS